MVSVIIRILLRYVAAALVAKGLLSPGLGEYITDDPEVAALVEIAAGVAAGAAAELWYTLARRFGWAK